MSVVIFSFLSIITPEEGSGRTQADERRNGLFSTIAFIAGAITSIVCGYLGMAIATYANARTAVEARKGIAPAFIVAFRSGAVMGFLLTGLGLISLFSAIMVFSQVQGRTRLVDMGFLGGTSDTWFSLNGTFTENFYQHRACHTTPTQLCTDI